ncbi:2-polyprenylphenol 6-hydroxylase [Pelagibacterium sp. H642]|uniref:2-polyprenylphenol 6-hydroxylase n=1 Tax=Pelagibacterium sp. H642 TaxID=1881069 RepID=UPI0028162FF2|nr:2-polyprenylphenol 6-hydroxylase [Pelagibacterium sp. H642]WMT92185.1 2-polyprenylphenol 6-hydroxylase [Pelagibacterium sp. H642]
MGLGTYLRLARAGFVLAREGAFSLAEGQPIPPSAKMMVGLARLIEKRDVRRTGRVTRLANALTRLGPVYVKLGQVLATRRDIVGFEVADDLAALQDALPPFDEKLVPGLLDEALGDKAAALKDISAPLAAASIAQVHKARLVTREGERTVAIKLLRPKIRERFARDLDGLYALAGVAERFLPSTRRFNGRQVVDALARSAALEMDLRMEAAAISELADNLREDGDFATPEVFWEQTGRSVLTTSWIEAIPVRDLARLDAVGIDRKKLAASLIQSFLRQAIRDGFFHADMHPGNLFADPQTGGIIAVDFGIMGRIGKKEQRFLAEILYGFITRDYRRVAELHIDIGYVPDVHTIDDFAQAIRAIGEPLVGRSAGEISMARVLAQLIEVTELFDMSARPELVLLQKNMVLVEGTARLLDPDFNMWTAAEPVVSSWVRRTLGPQGRIEIAREALDEALDLARRLPDIGRRAERVLARLETDQMRRERRDPLIETLKWGSLAAIALAIVSLVVHLGALL